MNIGVRNVQTPAELAAAEQFERLCASLPGGAAASAARSEAIARFAASGLPHRRLEDWKYTDLRTLLRELPEPATPSPAQVEPEVLAAIDAWRIVIVDGGAPVLPQELAAAGVTVRALSESLESQPELVSAWPAHSQTPILDLNTAFVRSGLVLDIPDGVILDRPVHLACVATVPAPAAIYLRNRIRVGKAASAIVVETYEGPDAIAYLVNTASRLSVADEGRLVWGKVQADGDAAVHLATAAADVGAGARLVCAPFTVGAAVSRNQIAVTFAGAQASADIAGVQLLGGRQHGDTTLFVDHALPGSASRELFKTVLDGRARGVFQGMILVRPVAQKTDGRMMSQALMLSDDAEMDNKPELEIYADDVQCGHGATAGRIDEDLLFYLRARGIPEVQAKALLIEAFVSEAIDVIGDDAIGAALSEMAHAWVADRTPAGES
jgi:Fe-S cluster assembly protein SufD